jgi:hypothetical protein
MVLSPDCTVQIVVSRADTGAEVARTEGGFEHRSVAFSHLTEDLYLVDTFHVRSRIWLSRGSMTGLPFASDVDVPVTSPIDRRRSFLTWNEHWAHFRNAGTGQEWWHRRSSPKLHRTAASAQCLAVRQRVARLARRGYGPDVDYVDALPFDWTELSSHRHQLCDYCFFGSPTITVPHPREDWFRKPSR